MVTQGRESADDKARTFLEQEKVTAQREYEALLKSASERREKLREAIEAKLPDALNGLLKELIRPME